MLLHCPLWGCQHRPPPPPPPPWRSDGAGGPLPRRAQARIVSLNLKLNPISEAVRAEVEMALRSRTRLVDL
eukprot:6996110-Prymnesium_polylepis.1